jgi:putative membrane protein
MKAANAKMIRKLLPFFALSIGLGFTIWLIAAASLTSILHSFAQIGWGIVAVVGVRAAMITMNAVAWRQLLANLIHLPFAVFALLRWIREAIDVLLPVAGLGGSLVSARLLTFWQVSGATALAGVAADVLLQTAAQASFALLGALLLASLVGFNSLVPEIILGIAAAVIVLGGFYVVQRYAGAPLIDRALVALLARTTFDAQEGQPSFQSAIDGVWHGRRRYVVAASATHICAWTLGTLEVWITLHFMKWPVSLEQAVILESLGASISSAAFFVPGSWGVQEAGYILIGQMLGLPAHLSLALSLVKRVPDLLLGAPGLLAWRILEARHLISLTSLEAR